MVGLREFDDRRQRKARPSTRPGHFAQRRHLTRPSLLTKIIGAGLIIGVIVRIIEGLGG